MSDDAINNARVMQTRLAATKLRRVEELQAELDKRTRDRASLDGLGDDPEVTSLKTDLDAKLADLAGELALARSELKAARDELKSLSRLDSRSEMAVVEDLMATDPVIRSTEQISLDNVREHIRGLDAQARVDAELADLDTEPITAPPVSTAKPSKEEADEQAKREFEALRAGRSGPPKKTL
jgi:hypothetical protein